MASEIIKDLGIFAGGSTLLYFLFRSLFKHALSKDIEKFNADLRFVAFQQEIRFSKLHEKRMKVIDEIYTLLVRTQYAFIELTKPFEFAGEPAEDEKMKEVYDSAGSLKRFFDRSRIYLTEDVCSKFEELNLLLIEVKDEYEIFLSKRSHVVGKERFEKVKSVWKKVSEDVNVLKKHLEGEFRKLFGVEVVGPQERLSNV